MPREICLILAKRIMSGHPRAMAIPSATGTPSNSILRIIYSLPLRGPPAVTVTGQEPDRNHLGGRLCLSPRDGS